jgi:phage/plasmid-associated DNA primase
MNFLDLTIEPRETILDGIILNEPIDLSILDKLINSTLIKETFNNPICKKIYTSEKIQLEKYRELIVNGKAIVKYNKIKDFKFGRCNPDNALGLFSIRREIRHTLSKNNFEDIDIDNCHPKMLEQILINNNYKDCSLLTDYINNRDDWFELVRKDFKIKQLINHDKFLMKDIPKNLFIRILFGGGVSSWVKDWGIDENIKIPKKILLFIEEVKKIQNFIISKNKLLVEAVIERKEKQNKKDYNLGGSVCSFYLQEKECMILEEIFKYCKENNYIKNNDCVLCADGLMISKKLYKIKLLDELKQLIKNEFKIDINFSNKKMDQDYLSILDKNLKFDLYTPIFTTGLIANYFRILYSNKFIFRCDNIYIYNGVYWKIDTDKKYSNLHNFVDTVFYRSLLDYIIKLLSETNRNISLLKEDDIINLKVLTNVLQSQTIFLNNINSSLRTVKKRKDFVEDIIKKLSNNYIEFDTDPFLLAFENKIYDLNNNTFIEGCYNQYISITTGWEWDISISKNNRRELDDIINSIFPKNDIKDYYLMALSTGLYGQQIEKLFIANGSGGNGKGLINSLMMCAVGNYGYRIPSTVLLNPIKEGGNPAVANMHKKRFCVSQEPDENQRICTSVMKELTGDCEINCRPLFSNDCKTILYNTLFLECNELPKMDAVNDAVIRRTQVIPFISRFVDDSTYEGYSDVEIKSKNIFRGNSFYKTDEFKHKYKQSLILILFEYFKKFKDNEFKFGSVPLECKEAVKDYLSVSDDLYSWFTEYYIKSDNSFIYLSDICDLFKNSKFYDNMNKKDKRDLTDKKFITKFKSSPFLEKNIREKDSTYNKTFHRKPYIIGYKLKEEDETLGKQSDLDL